ncbi:MAG: iron ABC transporter permease [Bacteroidia bacterium]|nr:iron ABC transporter permease [Bacteroidia bacterium]
MNLLKKNNKAFILIVSIIIVIILVFIDLINGPVRISISEVLKLFYNCGSSNDNFSTIFFDIRLPRVLTAIVAGLSLSVSGLLMQTLFRNPLAGPYVLGVSSGAGLGVAFMVMGFSAFGLNFVELMGSGGTILAACIGSGLFMLLIFAVSLKIRDVMTLLITGMLLGSAAGAIINVFQFAGSDQSLKLFVIWTMGSLGSTTWPQLELMSVVVLIGVVISLFLAYPLNVWLLGDENARASGVNISRVRNILLISTTLLAGSITAFCGPLAFVGIAAPHIARMISKTSDHRFLIPFSGIVGIAMLLTADILTQIPGSGFVLPINSTTSLLGVPIVLWIVLKGKKMWL